MESAMEQIMRLLKSTGMDDKEVEMLIARFLEEEAYDYVEFNDSLTESERNWGKKTKMYN
ncbi:MAG: hypothetical protein IKF80_00790 [Erysipelotrichaceae bacterium]|nr:hypothetical protein [Erysipelotrichaceae bacterium]